ATKTYKGSDVEEHHNRKSSHYSNSYHSIEDAER
ncbi:MAG: hypothetical protein ACI8RD_010484, partial [Bacillariaceae sp.]